MFLLFIPIEIGIYNDKLVYNWDYDDILKKWQMAPNVEIQIYLGNDFLNLSS